MQSNKPVRTVMAPAEVGLVTFAQYQTKVAHLFPSLGALEWFFKVNKTELLQSGAVVVLNRRRLVHPPTMSSMLLEIGQARSKVLAQREPA